jgi:uncharacterized protein YlxW (UPF0749 family)
MFSIKQGRASIALVCMVLGFMLAVQFRSTQDMKASLPYQRVEELSARLLQTEKQRNALQEEVETLKNSDEHSLKAVQAVQELRMRSGVTILEGPGVIVSIDDSKIASKAGENQNLYIIHDDDLLRVINELRAAGTEALSINGQRILATSEIRCAGPTLSVNNVRSAPPYEIRAIGDPQTLENALRMRGGVAETLKVWGIQLDIKASDNLQIPAYKGPVQFKYARTVDQEATP